jgi:CubicO group peptidase (beta-lactamase class C family)
MKKILKNTLLGAILLGVMGVSATFFSPYSHLRNYLKWGLHTVYDFRTHPSRVMAASEQPQPWPLDSFYNQRQIPDSLLTKITDRNTLAFLVFQHGKLRYERYWNHHQDSLSGSFSAAKSIVSLLIGKALEEGKIKSLDQPLADFIPSFAEGDKAKIRLRDLLTMSSGLSWKESDKSYLGLVARAYYTDNVADVVDDFEYKEPAGQTWEYRSGDTQVLGLVLEKVYGMGVADLANRYLLQPMGAEKPALWLTDGDKLHEKAFCCYNAVARDYARFGQLVLQKGQWNGRQLISEKYIAEAITPASYLKDPTENNRSVDFYGYQFWILNHPNGLKIPSMNGLFGQYVYVIKEKDAVVVRLGNSPLEKFVHHYQPENFDYINAALSVLD